MKIKKSKNIALVSLLVMGLTGSYAYADLIIGDVNSLKTNVESKNNKISYVKNIGQPINANIVKGMANNLPLVVVLKQIVPDGWKVKKIGNVDLDQKVSWQGNKQWHEIFEDVAEEANILADINWDQKMISVSNNTYQKSDMGKINHKNNKNVNYTNKNNGSNLNYAVNPYANGEQVWKLEKTKTLKENLQDWSTKIGWVLSWDAPDYRIVNDVVLYGSIDDPNGPIAKIVNSYKDAKQPLKAKINRGNKVIRIESRNYEQESVVQQPTSDIYNNTLSQ